MSEAEDHIAIEALCRLYAKATDLIGRGGEAGLAQALAIYRQIFTSDCVIKTSPEPSGLTASGPDAWAKVVDGALAQFQTTHHLIGTQLVELQGDTARMESHLQAWHQRADTSVFVYLGVYVDEVRRTQSGWKISAMDLQHTLSYELPADSR